jgi:signal recognition particle receptor subunit beta
MSTSEELKIVFTGPMGAGKTTAISVVSDFPPVRTEVGNNDQERFAKASTTVALDLGQLGLDDGTIVRLYGTPGQIRFSFMWEILGRGAIGVILLLDGSSPDMLANLRTYAEVFRRVAPDQPLLIGIGRTSGHDDRQVEACAQVLAEMDCVAPVLSVDVRKRDDVLLIIEILLAMLEARMAEAANDVH